MPDRLKYKKKLKITPLPLENFKIISDWYHFAILELTFCENFKSDFVWIAEQLNITRSQAKLAIERLLSLGLLRIVDGKLTKANQRLDTTNKRQTSSAQKLRQKQIRELAIQSIENDPIERRVMTSMSMCIDPELIDVARERIGQFCNDLSEELESKKRKLVYILEIGLLPVQKGAEYEV